MCRTALKFPFIKKQLKKDVSYISDGGYIKIINDFAGFITTLPNWQKRLVVPFVDVLLCFTSAWLAFVLRFDMTVPSLNPVLLTFLASICLALPLFNIAGLYRVIYRYSGLSSALTVVRATSLYALFFCMIFTVNTVNSVPRSIGLIQPILLFIFILVSRGLARVWLGDLDSRRLKRNNLSKTLIYGAGSAGRQLASLASNNIAIHVVGYLDDDEKMCGRVLNGVPIFNPNLLAKIVIQKQVTDVVLAMPSLSRQRRNEILEFLKPYRLAVRTIPSLNDIALGKLGLGDINELDIDDLLGREPVEPHEDLLSKNNNNKIVLVTGAGGSIGAELCRQIIKTLPRKLILVEISEFGLYKIHQELLSLADKYSIPEGKIEIVPVLASVCDEIRMDQVVQVWKPQTIYHAAAYKHVPLVEHNIAEGIRNNVWGTYICAHVALKNEVANFVLVSTDKAVRPTNIMGATKRLAEIILQALFEKSVVKTTYFSMVRFGNVLGSSGSVVPLFREQIKAGGPITLTHSEVTRYFMTIKEASQLVIQAGAMSRGGDVFLLDMGDPVRIIDLARRMVELSGFTVRDNLNPSGDIEIKVSGLRPGEKLYEELLIDGRVELTEHPKIMRANEAFLPWISLKQKLDVLNIAVRSNDVKNMVFILTNLVAEYSPGEVVDLIHLANQENKVLAR